MPVATVEPAIRQILFLESSFTNHVKANLGSPSTLEPIPLLDLPFKIEIVTACLERSRDLQESNLGRCAENVSY